MIKMTNGIKGMTTILVEKGKIKIGKKGSAKPTKSGGTFRMPQKLDHFRITTSERSKEGNFELDTTLHNIYGAKPTSLDIVLLSNDVNTNLNTRYALHDLRNLLAYGDGETFYKKGADGQFVVDEKFNKKRIDHNYKGKDQLKLSGVLNCQVVGSGSIIGVHKFRTFGSHSVMDLFSSINAVKFLTGGQLGDIPLISRVRPKD